MAAVAALACSGVVGALPASAGRGAAATPKKPTGVDLSWVGHRSGWLLARAHCRSGRCAQLYRTGNAGASWRRVHTPHVPVGRLGGTVAFTANGVGYLNVSHLYVTRDSGKHWTRLYGLHTEALAIGGSRVYRVAYRHTGCPGPCTPRIQEAPVGTGSWRTVKSPQAVPEDAATLTARRAGVIVTFLGNPAGGAGSAHSVLWESQDAGRDWLKVKDPCGAPGGREADDAETVLGPGDYAAALCVGRIKPRSFIAVSDTEGQGFVVPGRRVPFDDAGVISWVGRQSVAVGSAAESGSGRTTYSVAVTNDGGRSWHTRVHHRATVLDQATAQTALSSARRSAAYLADPFHVFVTTDDGKVWHQHRLPRH